MTKSELDDKMSRVLDVQVYLASKISKEINIAQISRILIALQALSITDDDLSATIGITENEIEMFKAYQAYLKNEAIRDALDAIQYIFD